MAEIASTDPARKRITGFLAGVALVALYSFGAVAVTGVASIAGASAALAQSYYYRGRGVRGTRGVTPGRTTTPNTRAGHGRGYYHNKGNSIELSSGGPSGETRGVGSSFDRRGPVVSRGGSDYVDRRGDDVRRDSGRDYAGPARGSGDTPRPASSRTAEASRRAADIESCARQYRSYDRETMSYTDFNGRRQSCP